MLRIQPDKVVRSAGLSYALTGDRFQVRGTMRPGLAGERVVVRFYRGGRKRYVRDVRVRPDGTFLLAWASGRPGTVRIEATHPASPALGTLKAAPKKVRVVRASARPGSRGPVVRLLQRGLAKLGYAVSRTGSFDGATQRAVMAYRKVNGLQREFAASETVLRRVLAGGGAFKPRHPDAGRHVEADISRQVMALIDGRRVVATYHVSSGAPATPTIIGRFRVYRKDLGTNALGMVHSSYFIRGYAIHGYASVPAFNASHGCLRVPIPDAMRIFRWIRHGMPVITYP